MMSTENMGLFPQKLVTDWGKEPSSLGSLAIGFGVCIYSMPGVPFGDKKTSLGKDTGPHSLYSP